MYQVRAAGLSDVGCVRKSNQDAYQLAEDVGFYVVADGMGGHAGGEVAAGVCVETLLSSVREANDWLTQLRSRTGITREERTEVLRILEEAIAAACHAIHVRALQTPELQGMGCTLSCMMVIGDRGFVGHVGDSRLYLLRSGELNALTRDHRVLAELLRAGRITPDRAKELTYIDGLSRAMGVQPSVQADLLDMEVLPGDRFLICSDGLHGPVPATDLHASLAAQDHDPAAAAADMIQRARDAGGPDNVTALVIEIAQPAPLRPLPNALSEREMTDTLETSTAELFGSKMQAVKGVAMFEHLSYQERVAFLAAADERTYQMGELLMEEDQPGEEFFILVTGECQVRKGDADIAKVGPGSPLGDMALVAQKPRSASVVALTTCNVIAVRRQAFFEFLRSDPVVATKVLWAFVQMLTDRLASTSSELHHLREGIASTAYEMPLFRTPPQGS